MKLPRPITALVVLSLAILSAELRAQTPAPSTRPVPLQPETPPTITVEFPGGTVAQLIELLAKTPGGLLNVIGEEKDLSTVLPPFSVRDVSPKGLAHALMQLLHPRGLVLIGTNLNVHGARDVYTLRREPNAVAFNYRGAFESIQLAPFLEHQKVDDIISAVRTAWELDPAHESDALRLKYHPATTILLISGPPEAINIAQKVVTGTLKRTREPDRKSEPKAAPAAEKK